ncbi:hypothetical protein [Telmatospirillum sp.]|uniref:hypothetical protein n=1 Tax=Telmatospirillum sp. TaxID=2079197 RepID=UPI00284077A9|nr:hypothetical protein [Telmatospirillum sp.]MDR3435292.1 hypothetical protein [Telmatospirillum sp.]
MQRQNQLTFAMPVHRDLGFVFVEMQAPRRCRATGRVGIELGYERVLLHDDWQNLEIIWHYNEIQSAAKALSSPHAKENTRSDFSDCPKIFVMADAVAEI